jgi:hypothetical protein
MNTDDRDDLAPARGCIFGLLIGAAMWALLYVAYKLL